MYESAKDRYNIILFRDLLTTLGLNIYFSENVINGGVRSLKGSTLPMVYLGIHEFKDLNTGRITSEEYFMNAYIEGVF